MPFFMNPFGNEFRGNWPLVDHHAFSKPIITFSVPANKNTNSVMAAYNPGPYDFSVVNTLTIYYAVDSELIYFGPLTINVAGVTPAATTATEVVSKLLGNATFATLFTAETIKYQEHAAHNTDPLRSVVIKSKRPSHAIRVYISNGGAETKMRFNKYAGIKELPEYFSRYTIANRDLTGEHIELRGDLIELDGTDTAVDRPIIREFLDNAAWTNSDLLSDWQHLKGQGGRFLFKKSTVNADGQPEETILWSAGSVAGDMGVRITQVWAASGDLEPTEYYEEPYVLSDADVANVP